ncbi:MAG: OmpA family protein [Crocinitomicaceae bacterium]|nr:OmpA family protein [Crocinitomicaceae bacterium]
MKYHVLIIFVLLVVNQTGFSQELFTAQVLVNDFNENPIYDAEVKLYDTTGVFKFGGTTGKQGSFDIQMHPGTYRVKLFKDGELRKDKLIRLPKLEGRRIYNKVRIFVLYEEREHFTLENLLFEYNSAYIYEESYPILNKLVDYLLTNNDSKFEISGHTDAIGSEEDNLKLSQDRADAVRDYLIEHGVNPDNIVAKGYGESKPVADNDTDEGRAKNRRTEVKKLE